MAEKGQHTLSLIECNMSDGAPSVVVELIAHGERTVTPPNRHAIALRSHMLKADIVTLTPERAGTVGVATGDSLPCGRYLLVLLTRN